MNRIERYEELLAEGRRLSPAERAEGLKRLAQHRDYPALLALVREQWEEWGAAFSSQKLANFNGSLEHTAGSMHAMKLLEGHLVRPLVEIERGRSGQKRRTEDGGQRAEG
jgi:hypothetical protein